MRLVGSENGTNVEVTFPIIYFEMISMDGCRALSYQDYLGLAELPWLRYNHVIERPTAPTQRQPSCTERHKSVQEPEYLD